MQNNIKNDLKIRAYKFALRIIKFVSNLPEKKIFWVMGDQLLRSGTSIGANIVEGKSSSSRKEFVRYYEIALKSANETNYWLCLFRDSDLIGFDKKEVEELLDESIQLAKILGSSLVTMKGKRRIS